MQRPGAARTKDGGDDVSCISCEQGMPKGECVTSKRECGHHCNHLWSHDKCDWCGAYVNDDGKVVKWRGEFSEYLRDVSEQRLKGGE